MRRWWSHLWANQHDYRRYLSADDLLAITEAIRRGEAGHLGQLKFAVESHLQPMAVWRGLTARDRALRVFGELNVWDTEANSGVLIYLLTVERDLEVVLDRAARRVLGPEVLDPLIASAIELMRAGQTKAAVIFLIEGIHAVMRQAFPFEGRPDNELSDQAVIL